MQQLVILLKKDKVVFAKIILMFAHLVLYYQQVKKVLVQFVDLFNLHFLVQKIEYIKLNILLQGVQ
ncbi:hypothetical protein SDC9_184720 [bioreactor metagenome]|uniref:Transmembrane protein n=1 Tax=bioreactor metagenome TaxID=1076179 RepID=A0A645HM72_9ZZZZ